MGLVKFSMRYQALLESCSILNRWGGIILERYVIHDVEVLIALHDPDIIQVRSRGDLVLQGV